jgi:O-antigen/teichoic acid export membrane protein
MPGAERDHFVLGLAVRGSLLVSILGAVFVFATQILLARLMGAEEYGIYYYALSWLLVIALISQFGFDQTLLRFMPIYIQDGDWSKARGILKTGWRLVTVSGVLSGALMILVVLVFGDNLSASQRTVFMVAALCLPLRGLIYIRQATLRSFMYTVRSLLPDAVIAPVVLMILAAIIYQVFDWSSAPVFMAATLIALSISFLVGAYWQSRLTPVELRVAEPHYETGMWLRVAFMMLIINGAHMLLINVDLLVLGFFRTPADVGVYGVSSRVATIVTFVLLATYPVFAPLIAKDHAAGRREELQHAIKRVMRPITGLAVLLSLALVVWGTVILGLFGTEFERGQTVLTILVGGQLVNALCGPVALLLAYGGHEPLVAKVLVAVLVISACLHFLVIPAYGMEGAAFVTALSVVSWNLALYVLTRRLLGIDPGGWFPLMDFDVHNK